MFDKNIETMGRAQMRSLQTERLKATIANCYDNVPFYRAKLDEIGLKPAMIQSIDDLKLLPFTVKADLRDNYPFGLLARPIKEIVRIHASSGTTGKPTVVAYTANDLAMWSECVARLVVMAGATADDVAQVAFGYGLFTGALGLHQGLERIGATVIPMSSGQTEKQLMLMQDFGVTVLIATPSYALYIAETAEENGVDISKLKLRLGLFGADSCSEEMRNAIERQLGIIATENYGLSEIIGPGVSGECLCKDGLHINEDCFIPEIINPDTGEVLPMGERGELVLTAVTKEGLPMLRYRTKDVCRLIEEPCKCGRTLIRMSKVEGRTDDMLIIHGVNLFPSQIEVALAGIQNISPYFVIKLIKNGLHEDVVITVELANGDILESYNTLYQLEKTIKRSLFQITGLNLKVEIVAPKTLERTTGKAKRVIRVEN